MPEPSARAIAIALLALGSGVALGLLVWLPRRLLTGRGWALFRCLLPSWRFFDRVELPPVLRFRVAPSEGDWGPWQAALMVPPRTFGSLWLNAAGNLHLACQSLVEHLLAELEEAGPLGRARDELVSYQLVCALIEQRAREALPEGGRYQFDVHDAAQAAEPIFVSDVHDSG